MRNVLFVAYDFPPRGGSSVQRTMKFAKYLPSFGYKPHVLTTTLDQITGLRDDSMLDELNGTMIYREASSETFIKKLSALHLGPAISFLLRPDAHVLWKRRAVQRGLSIASEHNIDVIYTTVQPWSSALVGLQLKRKLGVPWVLDFRDPWTQSRRTLWPTRLHYFLDRALERKAVREADAIIVVTPGMAASLQEAFPSISAKIHVVYNGFDGDDILSVDPTGETACVRIGYTGRLSTWKAPGLWQKAKGILGYRLCSMDFSTHSLFYILQAAQSLFDDEPDRRALLKFSFAGKCGRDNEDLVTRFGLDDVFAMKGYVSHAESIRLLHSSDVLFLPLMAERDGRRSYIASGKIFEYLALRKPILAAVPEGDAADIVRRARAGWVVEPHDVEGMKNLLKELIERKRAGALSIDPDEDYIRTFERKVLTRQLADVFDELLARRHRSSAGQHQRPGESICSGAKGRSQ